MRMTINGEPADLPEGISLLECLREREFDPAAVVVERNRVVVPAERFGETRLEPDDVLEILHFVGGG